MYLFVRFTLFPLLYLWRRAILIIALLEFLTGRPSSLAAQNGRRHVRIRSQNVHLDKDRAKAGSGDPRTPLLSQC
jgi:hypothetical protein